MNASLGLTSLLSVLSPWEISTNQRWSLPGRYTVPPEVQTHGSNCLKDLPTEVNWIGYSKIIHYLTFKTFYSSCFSFLFFFFVMWPHYCFKPGSHPGVFPLSITPHAPNLISHKSHHVNFLSVFWKDLLLHVTQFHFPFSLDHRKGLPNSPPIYSPYWPERWVYKKQKHIEILSSWVWPRVPWYS